MEDQQALLPGYLAARRAGVSRQLLNYWRTVGRLTPAGLCDGRPLYRVADVLDAERVTRNLLQSGRHRKRATVTCCCGVVLHYSPKSHH